jgi:2-isopropylmalate synthase
VDKIRVAEKLDAFGIDYIEGGWPGSNPKDIEFFREAAKRKWKHAKITAFGMTRAKNTPVAKDAQVKTLLDAETPAVTIFGKSWALHVEHVLRVSADENRRMIRDTVAFLKKRDREVIYDAEHFFDGAKDDWEHALLTLEAAVEGGADLVVLCDTNGGSLPDEVADMTARVIARLGNPVGIHTHNDSGVGVANALAAVRVGAVQVQGTINGYGERVGNCDLVSVIPTLQLKMGRQVVPKLENLRDLSHFVAELANVPPNIRAPYVGGAAFTHKGGTHVNAVQKLTRTYEHVDPALVGSHRTIVVSELSGQSNVLMRAEALGFTFEKGAPEVKEILASVKRLENDGYEFEAAEGSFELLILSFRRTADGAWDKCEATVKLKVKGEEAYVVAEGDGPVNALDAALRKALAPFFPKIAGIQLEDYKVRIINGQQGTGARTRVLITSTDGDDTWGTVGASDNVIEASWLALVDSFEYKLGRR